MRTSPTNWDEIVNTENYHYEVKLVMNGADYFAEDIMEMSTETKAMVSSKTIPAIGGALSGEIKVTLKYSGDDSLYNVPRMATLAPYVRVATDDGTVTSDWLSMSQYMIDTREIDKASGNFTLHGYDAMLKAEQTYFPSVTDDSMPSEDIVSEIATLIGVTVNADTASLLSMFSYEVPYYAGQYTAREMLQYIGVASGGNFYINNDNELALVRVAEFIDSDDLDGGQIASWTTRDSADGGQIDPWNAVDDYYGGRISPWSGGTYRPETIDIGSRAQSLTTDDEVEPYTQIVLVLDSQQEVTAGTGTNIYEAECPFATPDMADFLLMMFEKYMFRPFEADKALLTPLFEFGDYVVIAGETVKPYNYSVNFNVLMAADISASYNREVNHEFVYKPASERKIERVAANTYSQFRIMANEISSKVSQTDYNGNEIASLINQTATTIDIEASKINFSGQTVNMTGGALRFNGTGADASLLQFVYGNYMMRMSATVLRYYNQNNPIVYVGRETSTNAGMIQLYSAGTTNVSFNAANNRGTLSLYTGGTLTCYLASNGLTIYNTSSNAALTLYESSSTGYLILYNNGTANVTLSGAGTGYFRGNVTAANISDERLKQNIEALDNDKAKNLLNSLEARTYQLKRDAEKQRIGFIAQEILQVLSDCELDPTLFVYEYDDPEAGEKRYAVNYEDLTAVLWAGWQIHEKEIRGLVEKLKEAQ